jgi:hypothetical protein
MSRREMSITKAAAHHPVLHLKTTHLHRHRSVDGRLSAFTDGEVFALPLTNSKIDDQSGLHNASAGTLPVIHTDQGAPLIAP